MHGKWLPVLMGICVLLSGCGQDGGRKTVISIAETVKEYETLPYEEFKNQTGSEAEFYHATLFSGEVPNASLCVIYEGEYDEDIAGPVLADDAMPIRMQGSLGALMDGIEDEMSLAEFAEALSADGAAEAGYELVEGGGTAYYAGDKYVRIEFDSDQDGEYDSVLLISMDGSTGENIGPERIAWLE